MVQLALAGVDCYCHLEAMPLDDILALYRLTAEEMEKAEAQAKRSQRKIRG